jgi:hypothetical protein
MTQKKSVIQVNVSLDENNIPEKLEWQASDGAQDLSPLRIDLWTKDMQEDEMKHFFYQTLVSMADTLDRSTGETKMAEDMRDFCFHFKDKLLK